MSKQTFGEKFFLVVRTVCEACWAGINLFQINKLFSSGLMLNVDVLLKLKILKPGAEEFPTPHSSLRSHKK